MSRESATRWLRQALHDLQIAEKNISIEGFDVAAFLAHQSVEKLLKGILASRGGAIPRTHNIDDLAQNAGAAREVVDLVEEINADYLVARYPDMSEELPFEQYDRELSMQKVEAAKRIFELMKTQYAQFLEKK